MDIRMLWFSGTGNTRAIVDGIARRVTGGNVQVQPMVETAADEVASAQRLLLAFPVYAFGLPAAVAEFAAQLKLPEGTPIYAAATYAGLAGAPHHELRSLLRHRNLELFGGWTFKMPENYPVMKPPPPEKKQRRLFAKAEQRLGDVVGALEAGLHTPLADTPPPLSWLAKPLHRLAIRKFPSLDSKFHVEEQCTACGTCEKVCPVNNIRMQDKRPLWQGNCEQCFACVQWCPVEAIQWNARTQGKPRYHHPNYTAHDFFLNNDNENDPS